MQVLYVDIITTGYKLEDRIKTIIVKTQDEVIADDVYLPSYLPGYAANRMCQPLHRSASWAMIREHDGIIVTYNGYYLVQFLAKEGCYIKSPLIDLMYCFNMKGYRLPCYYEELAESVEIDFSQRIHFLANLMGNLMKKYNLKIMDLVKMTGKITPVVRIPYGSLKGLPFKKAVVEHLEELEKTAEQFRDTGLQRLIHQYKVKQGKRKVASVEV